MRKIVIFEDEPYIIDTMQMIDLRRLAKELNISTEEIMSHLIFATDWVDFETKFESTAEMKNALQEVDTIFLDHSMPRGNGDFVYKRLADLGYDGPLFGTSTGRDIDGHSPQDAYIKDEKRVTKENLAKEVCNTLRKMILEERELSSELVENDSLK